MEIAADRPSLGMASKVRPSPDAFFSQVSEEMVVLNLETGCYHSLNPIGAAIWGGLEGSQSVEDLCARLTEQYKADPEMVRADTLEFLDKLVERGLVIVD